MTHLQQQMAHAIRFLALDAIVKAQEGHQGVPLGMAEIATMLYARHLKHDPTHPDWFDRDRVVLSNGHGSMLLYALLHLTGYARFDLPAIQSFRQLGSPCEGHPERDVGAGIEVTTGPLGQGIANALGMAVAEAHLRARFGPDWVDHHTYAFVGDGCLQEGIGQEMISLAGHLRLGKLILLWDNNRITDDGSTDLSISEDVAQRFRVAQWHVQEVDGHDMEAVSAAIEAARHSEQPSLIACATTIAKGIERLQGQRGGHSARLFEADAQAARQLLNWPHAPFEIPAPVLQAWRAAGQRHRPTQQAWQARVQAMGEDERLAFMRCAWDMPGDPWRVDLHGYKARVAQREPASSGIFISGEIQDVIAAHMPDRMVACADLEAPMQHKRGAQAFTAQNPAGQYVHCGVREHVMGAMANGMAAHGGVAPYALTYLAFADYMRPAMRMAALMALPVRFVFSHDSIGIGRNGPTHQPVEMLASLRAMPNMLVMRPADAIEAAECYEVALQHRSGPVSLVFARQALPHVRTDGESTDNLSSRGGYVLAPATGERRVTLLATGSEVALALTARAQLQAQGIGTAVASLPCFELFDQQPEAYRQSVLGQGVRIGIEAAVRQGWDAYLGPSGAFVGMQGFGASGAAEELYAWFGITPQAVVQQAMALLG
jgi:transketolase